MNDNTQIFRASGKYVAPPAGERVEVWAIGGVSSVIVDLEPGMTIDITVGKGGGGGPDGVVIVTPLPRNDR